MKILFNKIIILAILTITTLPLISCQKSEVVETTIKTEIQEIEKPLDDIREEVKETKPIQQKLTTDELITNTLLEHYKSDSPQDNPIIAVGYKMYLIEDGKPGEKKAYGYAQCFEYKIDGDRVLLDCGSGKTPVALTFSLDGKVKRVDYEVLTDSDINSAEFKAAFPESVRPKILEGNQNDMDEIDRMQNESVKKQYKEITGKELTTEIPYNKTIN